MSRNCKIINYFIILQLVKFDRSKARKIFLKFADYLEHPFDEIALILSRDIPNIFELINDNIKINAESVLDTEKNGNIIYYEDFDAPTNIFSTTESPIVVFYQGNKQLLYEKSISVVGTRRPTEKGVYNAERIAKFLMNNQITVVSGLAEGIDYITQYTCADYNYKKLIAVIGTPISKYYPIKNKKLQEYIKLEGLLVSEYANFENTMKWNFLRRNYLMSSISNATIVIEAGDTSGTVSQARSTLKNGKPLFVPNNVFENPENSWPTKFRNEFGKVFKFKNYNELMELLNKTFWGEQS